MGCRGEGGGWREQAGQSQPRAGSLQGEGAPRAARGGWGWGKEVEPEQQITGDTERQVKKYELFLLGHRELGANVKGVKVTAALNHLGSP